MSEPSESSRAPVKHADTPATGSDSDQSMEDVQSPSPTNTVFSNSAVGSEAGQARPGTSSGTGRKRKVPDSVTPNACTNCKRARAKGSTLVHHTSGSLH